MEEQNNIKRTDVNTLGEFGLIDHLTKDFTPTNPSTIKGVGDDCAIIDNGKLYSVISTDMLVEGIHFDRIYTPLKHLGYKSIISNLSDIYACNATPQQVTVSIALSNQYSIEDLEEIYSGIHTACKIYGVDLVGGDTTSSNKGLIISVTAIGQVDPQKVVYRSGAQIGDLLCVTGDLGAAYLGLQLLEREKDLYLSQPDIKPDLENQAYLLERQLKPEARRDVIELFAKSELQPTSMIDISDGLASEVFHICKQSGVGAFIEEAKVPLRQETELMALQFNLDPITCALNGGEDYELLFTISPEDLDKTTFMTQLFIIGEITPKEDGIKLHTSGGNIHDLQAQGWKHF